MNYLGAKAFILGKLTSELPKELYYHGLHHTLDVLKVAEELCSLMHVTAYETMLLKTAVLFHDAGFMVSSQEHEVRGCKIARENLPGFGYNDQEIERICGMILATKIPQSPTNKLEEIICDADLDYLGRPDFYSIGTTLFKELQAAGVLKSEEEWNRIQVRFLENHGFFTSVNKERRRPEKLLHLANLKALVATYS
ncbi:MAG: HD domain-containing protein [Lewinella sp.]|jgi:predicted metal-dependent HD superfamily phosphohydrolase|uniref:HD domain-containing protein n=1 Tax=Lewinella sp. TaxID=2004506 RepID=UPI003D6C538C